MKKKFLDFTKIHIYRPTQSGLLPELRTRHNKGACFRSGGSSDDDTPDDDDDDDDDDTPAKKESKILLKKIKSDVRKQLETRAAKKDVDNVVKQLEFLVKGKNEKGELVDSPFPIEALRSMADEKSGVMKKLTDQGLLIQELKAKVEDQVKSMDVRSQVAKWAEENKETLAKIKSGEEIKPKPLEIRAAGTMHVSNVNAGASPYIGRVEVLPGINPILRFDNTFWDYIRKGRTGAPTIVWVNMVNPDGEAGWIGPGVAKPGIDFELSAETSNAKKIAVSAKAGTEILQDIDGMTDMIENEMRDKLYIKINEILSSNGAGSGTVPAGIRYYAQDINGAAFTTAFDALKTTTPNNMDAIRSAVAALRSGKLRGRAVVFINPIDMANMDMAKATDSGVYIIPPFTTADGRTIAGATLVEDQNQTIGEFGAYLIDYYVIKIYKDYTISWGWENDDFTKNLVTAVAEMRMHQYVNSINTGFAFYDSFADVIAKITQA